MRPSVILAILLASVGCQGPGRCTRRGESCSSPRGCPPPTVVETSTVVPSPTGCPGELVPARVQTTTTYRHHCKLEMDSCQLRLPFPHLRIFTGPDKVVTQTEYLRTAPVPPCAPSPMPLVKPSVPLVQPLPPVVTRAPAVSPAPVAPPVQLPSARPPAPVVKAPPVRPARPVVVAPAQTAPPVIITPSTTPATKPLPPIRLTPVPAADPGPELPSQLPKPPAGKPSAEKPPVEDLSTDLFSRRPDLRGVPLPPIRR